VPDILSENLQKIDEVLAEQNIPITDRPLAALNKLLLVGAIMEEDGTPVNSELSQVVGADWFSPMMSWITAWYRLQYGNAARVNSKEPLTGFLLIKKTPFLLHAPPHIVNPGRENGTAWLHLVDRVLDEENALDWVHNLRSTSDPSERQRWKADATAVAAALRFIQNRVVSLKADGNEELLALARSIVPHFGQAAVMVASHKPVETIRSYWELQIAAEGGIQVAAIAAIWIISPHSRLDQTRWRGCQVRCLFLKPMPKSVSAVEESCGHALCHEGRSELGDLLP
jgi:hypothetical protein